MPSISDASFCALQSTLIVLIVETTHFFFIVIIGIMMFCNVESFARDSVEEFERGKI